MATFANCFLEKVIYPACGDPACGVMDFSNPKMADSRGPILSKITQRNEKHMGCGLPV